MGENLKPDIGFKKEKVIEGIIRRASSRTNGLTLVTAPTGSGKSYDTSQFLAKHIAGAFPNENSEDKRKHLYITQRRKNCKDVYDDIKKRLIEAGREDLISDVLILPSYEDSLTNKDALKVLNNCKCKAWEETKALAAALNTILKMKEEGENTYYLRKRVFGSEEDFGLRDSLEWAFRKRLKSELKKDHEEYLKKLIEEESLKGKKLTSADLNKELRKRKKEIPLQKYFLQKEYWKAVDWSFIEKLYPASTYSTKKVLIMTTSKFLSPIDPIYESSFYFHMRKEKLCILIDEIDDTKKEVLEHILGNIMTYDLVNLFGVMAKPILTNKVEGVVESIIEQKRFKKRFESLKTEIISITKTYFPEKEQVKLFELAGNSLEPIYEGNNMLNYVGETWFFDSKMGYMYVPDKAEFNEKKSTLKCNKICNNKDLNKLEKYNESGLYPTNLLNDLRKCVITNFTGFVADIAKEYSDITNRNSSPDNNDYIVGDKISDKAALTTVLKSLNFDDDNARQFAKITALETASRYKRSRKKNFIKDRTFYGGGILLTYVVSSSEFRENAKLNSFRVPYTPEAFLANLAINYNVIGISATATHNGLHNYNIEYLKNTLGEDYHELTAEEKNAIKKDYEEKTIGYSKHNIKTEVNLVRDIEPKEDFYEDVIEVLKTIKDEEDLTITKKKLRNTTFKDAVIDTTREWLEKKHDHILSNEIDEEGNIENDYKRVLRIVSYVAMMLKEHHNKGISSGIILSMKAVGVLEVDEEEKNNKQALIYALTDKTDGLLAKKIYSIPVLQLFASYIGMEIFGYKEDEAVEKAKEMFVSIVASDLKEDGYNSVDKYKHFEERFKENEPVFMVSTYSSIARGNNLQVNVGEKYVTKMLKYPEENVSPLYQVNPDRPVNGEIDWDSIYIDNITHIIPNLNEQKTDWLKPTNLYSKEYRQFLMKVLITTEECTQRRQISVLDKNKILEEILIGKAGNTNYVKLYNLDVVKIDKTVHIYQAIGRIARTNVKKKHNSIYVSEKLVNEIVPNTEKLGIEIGSREFEVFTREVEKLQLENEPDLTEKEKKLAEKCKELAEKLREFTHSNWTTEKMAYWEEVGRAFPLTHFSLNKTTLKVFTDYFSEKYTGSDFPKLSEFYVKVGKKSVGRMVRDKKGIRYNYGFTKRGELRINFSSVHNKTCPFEVSEENSRLSALTHSDYIRDFFNEYAEKVKEYYKNTAGINDNNCRIGTGFKKSPTINEETDKEIYVLNPVAYTNLFKGGIGELALQAYFRKNGLELESITEPEEFEKFDFKIKNYPGFYVDAKNYGEETLAGDLANFVLKDKTKNKAALINAKHVFVINIIDPSTHREKKTEVDAPITALPGIFNEFCNDKLPEKKYNDGCLELNKLSSIEDYEKSGQKTAIEIVKDILLKDVLHQKNTPDNVEKRKGLQKNERNV